MYEYTGKLEKLPGSFEEAGKYSLNAVELPLFCAMYRRGECII